MTATSLPKVVFLDRSTISPGTVIPELPFDHVLEVFDTTPESEVAGRIADAEIVITNKVRLNAEALENASKLRLIAVAATGTDNIDLQACSRLRIGVTNVRNYAVNTVPEHTFALIFALRRSLTAYHDAVRQGRWAEAGTFCFFDYPIKDVTGSTIGIIGNGVLGKAVGSIARALGMRVLFSAHKGRDDMGVPYTPFDEVLKQSDIITLHCPLSPLTRHLISTAEFEQMARKPLLINTARGGLVDELALVEALRAGHISGAGFDVATQEPPGPQHVLNTLKDMPNFILTPHVAWASQEGVQALADQLMANIAAFWSGQPVNMVIP